MKIAVIGGGPIGLEAALEARRRGWDVALYEADRIGAHLRRFGHVQLFTPFRMNATEAGRTRLEAAGVALPAADALLSAAELVERYLVPLARLPELKGSIHERERVTGIGREGITKPRGVPAVGDTSREGRAFVIRVETAAGAARLDRADVVLDASGVYATPNATGPGGLPAVNEERLGDRAERWLPDLLGGARTRYRGRKILLVGDGHSAATALVQMDDLSRAGAAGDGFAVEWVHRDRGGDAPYGVIEEDPLPARRELALRANAIARSAPWLRRHPGAAVLSYDPAPEGRIRATLQLPSGEARAADVDRVLALVGYRPDIGLCRELQVHLCYASEAPMGLAAALLAARSKDPGAADDCLSQVSHGAGSLRNPEPGFFVVGAKSYGRNASFLLTIGHRQIADVLDSGAVSFPVAPSATGRTMNST
jgi:hypothetical protein